ncbi:glycerol-3-phosphate acyltransferase [Candidatus Aminicenantes bacterium AC-335-A11]|jgi:glycerol-3-phosphate acyltransferase PlsY|nr:glycerol-3-phosphate acyltransferase [SCandidatus Aminicenantes bacterium Aminicenantia_JdfR_composite]MCP2596765.1 glycerol-3-phosphate acyltransferase [Candidatus Aminicenantes bacterium AC-335-G13]MCP2617911.1 glycerol-3-phosphate acyltransferase [Candidatus Aminicenantes bacterium AC-335-A11]
MSFVNLISLLIGYLIGSFSPSYFLGKLLKGIDIREHGDGNAGGTNVYYVLGLKPAIVVALADMSKGLISMYLAYKLGASNLFIHLAGLSAIAGHVFPFYLSFRGGKGIATGMGILFYYFYVLMSNKWLPYYVFLLYLVFIFLVYFITRRKEILGIIALPSLLILILIFAPFNLVTIFSGIIIIYIFIMNFALNILKLWKRAEQA